MLTVTRRALEKLKETLRYQCPNNKKGIRLVLTPSGITPFDFILDEEGDGDQVVTCEDGRKVLLVGRQLAAALSKMVIDYRTTPIGVGFTLTPSDPIN